MRDAFVGRQPIFDSNGSVYAYELLFRDGNQNNGEVFDGNRASSQVLVNTLTEFGLENIVGSYPAFINMTQELLSDDIIQMLPKEHVVLEVLENVTVDNKLINTVSELSNQGFTIALDDFTYSDEWLPLVEIADIIKLDILALSNEQIEQHVELLHAHNKCLLAEKVETGEQFTFLQQFEFDFYQGYYLSRPSIVEGKRTPTNKLLILQLLAKLSGPEPVHSEIEALIVQDVALSYRILRYINAACFALPRKVDSINEAIIYLGLSNIRRISSMLVMSGFNDVSIEVLQTALLRARMCELLAEASDMQNTDTCFSLGLFSALDIMLQAPLSEIVSKLPLDNELQQALLMQGGELSELHECVLAYERQQWSNVSFADLSTEEISNAYLKAVQWSNESGKSLQS